MEFRINPTAGLANRLRSLGCAMWLSDLSDRDLVLGWVKYAGCNAEFNQIFKTEFDISPRVGWRLHYSHNSLTDPYVDFNINRDIQVTTYGVFSYKEGPKIWSKEMWHEVAPYIQSLHPIDEIQDVVSHFCNQYSIKDRVGVHIRRTDNTRSSKYSKLSYFYSEMDKVDKDFFICSDCEKTIAQVAEKYKGRCVSFNCTSKEYPNSRGTVRGIKRAACELLLLGQTIKIVGSVFSSFGTMASVIGGAPIKRVGEKSDHKNKVFVDDTFKKWDGSEEIR
jgi:hypothetical protein